MSAVRWDLIDLVFRVAAPLALDRAGSILGATAPGLHEGKNSELIRHGILVGVHGAKLRETAQLLESLDPLVDAESARRAIDRALTSDAKHGAQPLKTWAQLAATAADAAAAAVRLTRPGPVACLLGSAATIADVAGTAAEAAQSAAEWAALAPPYSAAIQGTVERSLRATASLLVRDPEAVVRLIADAKTDPVGALRGHVPCLQVAHDCLLGANATQDDRESLWALGLAFARSEREAA